MEGIGGFTMMLKKTPPKCWICKDAGMVFYNKTEYGYEYEFAYRCNCILGQVSSSRIMTLSSALGETLAMENYSEYQKYNPEDSLDNINLPSLIDSSL